MVTLYLVSMKSFSHLTKPGGCGPHGLRPGHDGDGAVVGGRLVAGEEAPGGGAEVLAEEEVDEEVGGAVDAHQQVRRLDDELDRPVDLEEIKRLGGG